MQVTTLLKIRLLHDAATSSSNKHMLIEETSDFALT